MILPRTIVAVLDDEPQFGKALGRLLMTHGLESAVFTSGEAFLAACSSRMPDCLIIDMHMPDMDGITVMQLIAAQHLLIPTIAITGDDRPALADRVRALGGIDYLLKPLNESQLLAAIRSALSIGDSQ